MMKCFVLSKQISSIHVLNPKSKTSKLNLIWYNAPRRNVEHMTICWLISIFIFKIFDYYHYLLSKIEKVPRGIRGEKSSKDMASSRNLVSTIGALASPKMGDGTRCPEG